MKILYLGHFDRTWTTETHLARDLEHLGHTVERVEEPVSSTMATLEDLEARALDGAALLLWTRIHPLPAAAVSLWRRLERAGVRTASFHLDLYRGIRRPQSVPGMRMRDDPFWATGTVFTADGDPESARWFARQGVNHVWSPPAVVSDECYPGRRRARFAQPVVFVGQSARFYPSEWPWRGRLLSWLQATYGRQFGLYPQGGQVRGRDLNDLYVSATVVVGDSLCPEGHSNYWSDRLVETIGRGGFLIFPWIDGIEDQGFVDGKHLRFYRYGDLDGLGQLIDYYMAHPDEARMIAMEGQRFVTAHHTYQHRAAAMIERLGLS